MSEHGAALFDRAAALRLAFDRAFADPYPPDPPARTELLEIALGSAPYALRLDELARVVADPPVVTMPEPVAALAGIVALSGAILPVYDLAVLLGRPRQAKPRWLAVAAARPAAFAFTNLQGRRRLAAADIVPQAGEAAAGLVRELAGGAAIPRPIVHLPSVLDAVARLAAAAPPPPKER